MKSILQYNFAIVQAFLFGAILGLMVGHPIAGGLLVATIVAILPFTHKYTASIFENASGAQTAMASKIVTMFDILRPSVRQQLLQQYGDQFLSTMNLLEGLGYVRSVDQRYTTQYEEDWIHQAVYMGDGFSSLGSNRYSFPLSTVSPNISYLEQNTTSPYTTANQYVFPIQKWQIITLPENNVKMQVYDVQISGSTCTVYVQQTNTSKTFTSGNYVAGTKLIVTSNAYAEGSDVLGTQVNKPLIDHAYTQIIKTRFVHTGSQAVSQPWFTEYTDGSGIPTYVAVGTKNTHYEHTMAIDDAMLFGDLANNPVVDTDTVGGLPNGEPAYQTEGLESYIVRRGNNVPYVPGTFSVTTFDYLDKLLEQNGAPSWMAWMCGTSFDNEKDNVLKAYFQNTMQEYMMNEAKRDLFTGDPGMAQEVKFRYLDKGQRKWCFGRMPRWNQFNSWGTASYKKDSLSLIYPLGTQPDRKNNSIRLPYFGMIYRALNGYSRKAQVWSLNGAVPGDKVLSYDRNLLLMLSDLGAEHAGGPQMARLYAA